MGKRDLSEPRENRLAVCVETEELLSLMAEWHGLHLVKPNAYAFISPERTTLVELFPRVLFRCL